MNPIKENNLSISSWMSAIDDRKLLSQLSIPGTHNTCANYETIPDTAKCQVLSLSEQLNIGIRYLDIRCRHISNRFDIHHKSTFQNVNFENVLDICAHFLKENPSETIFMSIKEEYMPVDTTRNFDETFRSYIDKSPELWFLEDRIPILQQARGKIIPLLRFHAEANTGIYASSWEDNSTFIIEKGLQCIKIQDCYLVFDSSDKWTLIKNMLDEVRTSNEDWLYLNYTSGYKLLSQVPNITSVSNYMNPRVLEFLNIYKAGRLGIVVMDFINDELSSSIIKSNFK